MEHRWRELEFLVDKISAKSTSECHLRYGGCYYIHTLLHIRTQDLLSEDFRVKLELGWNLRIKNLPLFVWELSNLNSDMVGSVQVVSALNVAQPWGEFLD
jgi:hypothetical protein